MHTFTRLPIIPMSFAALCLAALLASVGATFVSGAPGAPGAQTGAAALPADVNPDSRNRLATAAPDPAGGAAAAANAIRSAGTGVNARWESPVGRPLLELAILITAREHDAPFEWSLHEMEAVAVGLDPAVIDVVRNREPMSGLGDREAVIIQAGREIFGEHRLSQETYRRAVELFGEANYVDVVDLMARYAGTAARLAAFNQQMPPGWPQFLPLPFTPPDDLDPRSRSRLPLTPSPAEQLRSTPSLYGRTLSPQGTGPGQIGSHGAGRASLEANVARPLLDLAILVTARAYDVQYAWTLTEPAAVENGLDPNVIDVVREGGPVAGLGDKEAALITFGRELFGPHTVSPETYANAVEAVGGTTNLVDLVGLMAQHVSDATLLIAFDQHLPEGRAPLLTMP
jgi:4-carboxymuconolactone decarboxylase